MSNEMTSTEEGFSLLEAIVALSIMAVGFVTILQLFSESIRSVETSDEYLKAISLAHHKMNGLELDDFETDEFSGSFQGEEEYRWEIDIRPYDTVLNEEESEIQVMEVTLNILWENSGRDKNVELVTLQTVGTTYTTTDKVWLGEETQGIYGKFGGGGVTVGLPPPRSNDPEIESPPESKDVPMVRFCGNEIPNVNVSGLGTGSELRVSGG